MRQIQSVELHSVGQEGCLGAPLPTAAEKHKNKARLRGLLQKFKGIIYERTSQTIMDGSIIFLKETIIYLSLMIQSLSFSLAHQHVHQNKVPEMIFFR